MKHLWSIICSKLIIDKETNNATLVDLIEELKTENEKELIIPFQVVSLWLVEKEEECGKRFDVLIDFFCPKNTKLNESHFSIEAPQKQKRIRTNIKFDRFFLRGSGTYTVRVFIDKVNVAEIPIEITIV